MRFIETPIFTEDIEDELSLEEYRQLQLALLLRPTQGELIRGYGGLRKIRWRRPGMGKRGGLRVIYFVRYQPNEFWMLTLYAKAQQENVPAHILRQLKEAFERG